MVTENGPGGEGRSPPRGTGAVATLRRSPRLRLWLPWLLAVATYGVGDTLTTLALVEAPGLAEANPVVRLSVERFGAWGLLAVKQLVVCVTVLLAAYAVDEPVRSSDLDPLPPLILCGVGVVTTISNAMLLVG